MNKLLPAILLSGAACALAMAATDTGAAASLAGQERYLPVTGQPYSATQTSTMHRVLPDGSESGWERRSRLYRDSAGRMREDTLDSSGAPELSYIVDTDASAVLLDHRNRTVFRPIWKRQARPLVESAHAERPARMPLEAAAPAPESITPQPVVEQLGERKIEGVRATGRIVRRQGEDCPRTCEASHETWISEEMKTTLYDRHSSPGNEAVTALGGIDRSEPDAALFAVPAGYRPLAPEPGEAAAE